MTPPLTSQELQFLQSYLNDMYQSDTLRSGPMGPLITSLRSKFLYFMGHDGIDLSLNEVSFLTSSLIDTFQTSKSPIVTSQLGNSMRLLGESERKMTSSISELNKPTSDGFQGTFTTMWDIMESILTKIGLATVAAYPIPKAGPLDEPFGINPGLPNVNPDDRMT